MGFSFLEVCVCLCVLLQALLSFSPQQCYTLLSGLKSMCSEGCGSVEECTVNKLSWESGWGETVEINRDPSLLHGLF